MWMQRFDRMRSKRSVQMSLSACASPTERMQPACADRSPASSIIFGEKSTARNPAA